MSHKLYSSFLNLSIWILETKYETPSIMGKCIWQVIILIIYHSFLQIFLLENWVRHVFSPLTIAYSMYLSFVKKSGGRFVMSLQTQGMCQLEYECLKYSYFLSQEKILKTVGKSLCYNLKMFCFTAVYIYFGYKPLLLLKKWV